MNYIMRYNPKRRCWDWILVYRSRIVQDKSKSFDGAHADMQSVIDKMEAEHEDQGNSVQVR